MNCEQVEERLSPYLDNMLAPDERREVTIHLQACPQCMMSLAELRQNDILLAQLPRVSPSTRLRQQLFSMPEVLELARVSAPQLLVADVLTQPTAPAREAIQELPNRPPLVTLPGGRTSSAHIQAVEIPRTPPTQRLHTTSSSEVQRRKKRFTPLKLAIAAILVVAVTTASLLGLSLRHPATNANTAGAITPPAAGPGAGQSLPLAAGTRFVFLRDGALWSTLADGSSHQPERLTPANVTVAANWTVSPTMPGHTAGDLLAYIDLQSATVHVIRSDGQQDTTIHQPLLRAGSAPVTVWETTTGEAILNSLAWSRDGSMLAFAGDPAGNGQTNLYIYSVETEKIQEVPLSLKGSVAHPVWSPDSARLAFEVTRAGVISVLDYNVQDRETLDLSNLAQAKGSGANGVLTLGWSPSISQPAVTWSLGSIGHVSSLWLHRVGAGGTPYPQRLLSGDYLQALYSPNGDNGAGGWLLVTTAFGQASDLWRIDLVPEAPAIPLSQGKQVSFARWSPDGASVFYLDGENNGFGHGHLVNVATGVDHLLANNVAVSPAPAWSANGLQLAYSTGTRIAIVNVTNGSQILQLRLRGLATSLTWSPASEHQLVVALQGTTPGIYLADTLHNSALRLDQEGMNTPIQWTEIP